MIVRFRDALQFPGVVFDAIGLKSMGLNMGQAAAIWPGDTTIMFVMQDRERFPKPIFVPWANVQYVVRDIDGEG